MLIPYAVDVPQDRTPVVNWLLIASNIAVFVMIIFAFVQGSLTNLDEISPWVLTGWDIQGLIGHMWLHAGPIHLAGNMLFLWVFGNAVCSKVGNLLYIPVYLAFGLFAAAMHLIFDGGPAVGASGAINGVVGMFLVFYPLNDICCYWMMYLWYHGNFRISSYWMILFWLAFDIYGAFAGGGNTAYFAHLGGFAMGVALGFLLLALKWVKMTDDERSLVCIIKEWRQNRLDDQLAAEARLALQKVKEQETEAKWLRRTAARLQPNPSKVPPPRQGAVLASDPNFIRFICPCGQQIKVPRIYAGRDGMCPACKNRVTVPSG